MPYSSELYKQEIFNHIKTAVKTGDRLLDVGPGAGKYGRALSDYDIDAVEIWAPYIDRFSLKSIYKTVYLGDILTFDWKPYNYIILGDVLEHIELAAAQRLISAISNSNIKCLVAVPYMYEQGESEGNTHETHLQPDLTPENMLMRYPELNHLMGDAGYGYYINYI